MGEPESSRRLEELLAQLDATLAALEESGDSHDVVEKLSSMAELAREVQAEIERLRRTTSDATPDARS